MKKTRAAAVVVALVATTLGIGAAPAFASREINFIECSFDYKNEYFHLGIRNWNGTGTDRCFANAGEITLNQGGVENFRSGNNAGWFEYNPGDGPRRHTFAKWEGFRMNPSLVTRIHIN
ncbi:beta/gamma crystallin [Amycolatopsis sulphurea]|uniref:Beta/gamma crystallin n=1 Tax=Amycolatopsis sulphurea TaxID=76022 RepID=A0A2A9F4Y4_9PSEU|nr:beta/gamma crystallin domain-containing protein [Amycolatopsis sulphurea]PFG46447.1 beta/gamma crystallin [Amycolatopsis sulphurea]